VAFETAIVTKFHCTLDSTSFWDCQRWPSAAGTWHIVFFVSMGPTSADITMMFLFMSQITMY